MISTALVAWRLNPPQTAKYESVRLPGNVFSITGHSNLVGIVTASYEILIWTIGESLKSVGSNPPDGLSGYQLSQVAVVFHPLDRGRFYVLYGARSEDTNKLSVQEFIEGQFHARQLLNIHFSEKPLYLPITGLMYDGTIPIVKFLVDEAPSVDLKSQPEPKLPRTGTATGSSIFRLLTFDIYDSKCVMEEFLVPGPRASERNAAAEKTFIWRGQALTAVYQNPLINLCPPPGKYFNLKIDVKLRFPINANNI